MTNPPVRPSLNRACLTASRAHGTSSFVPDPPSGSSREFLARLDRATASFDTPLTSLPEKSVTVEIPKSTIATPTPRPGTP